jgi:hypothetical protein
MTKEDAGASYLESTSGNLNMGLETCQWQKLLSACIINGGQAPRNGTIPHKQIKHVI